MADGPSYKRRLALLEVALLAGEAAATACPLAAMARPGGLPRGALLRAAIPVGAGALALWLFAMAAWLAPIQRAVVRRQRGGTLDRSTAEAAYLAIVRTPRRTLIVRPALWTCAVLAVGVILWARGELGGAAVGAMASVAALGSFAVSIARSALTASTLWRVRPALLPGVTPLRLLADRYRERLVDAGLGLSSVALAVVALLAAWFLPSPVARYRAGVSWVLFAFGASLLLWYALLRRFCVPIERYLDVAVRGAAGERLRIDDPRAAAAYRAAQALPYRLALAKVLAWSAAALVLALCAGRPAGLARDEALALFASGVLVGIGAALYEAIWHRATLRELLSIIASSHRLRVPELRTRLGLRGKLLAAFGGLVLFDCGMSMVWGVVQPEAAPRALLLFFLALAALSAGIVWLVVRDVVRPIRVLGERAAELSKGELGRAMYTGGDADEIGMLACSLEEMRRALRERLRSTEELTIDLEHEVERRTADLAKKNRELSEALEKLKRAQAELVRAEKMASIGQLVAGIAHEINNPVNAVVNTAAPLEGVLEDLVRGVAGERAPIATMAAEARDMLRVIQRGGKRAKDIVQALHNYSRSDDERTQDVDLHRGIDDSLDLLRHRLKGGIRVEKDYGPVGTVRGHAGQLHQVFMNILTNAAQALGGRPDGAIRIRTSLEDGAVVVRVEDNGPGIAPEILPRIFDPFFTTKDVGEGSGLGLSIVHGIVERHGGTIDVESEVGAGTTFTVRLPQRGAQPATPVVPSAAEQ